MPIRVDVSYHGNFFTRNPVGQLRKNLYRDVLPEIAEVGAAAATANLTEGRGVVTGALRDSVEPRLVKASRFNQFVGKARVIAGAKGAPAPGRQYPGYPEKRNRAAAATVQRKYRFMYRAAALTQSWVSGHASQIAAKLAKGLS